MRNIDATERDPARIAEVVHRLGRKRWGAVTLTANVASTDVTDVSVTADSIIHLVPQTANAAAAQYASPYCLITPAKGGFTIAHANNAQTDRDFLWVALGG